MPLRVKRPEIFAPLGESQRACKIRSATVVEEHVRCLADGVFDGISDKLAGQIGVFVDCRRDRRPSLRAT